MLVKDSELEMVKELVKDLVELLVEQLVIDLEMSVRRLVLVWVKVLG